jgi:hypothetical protein
MPYGVASSGPRHCSIVRQQIAGNVSLQVLVIRLDRAS